MNSQTFWLRKPRRTCCRPVEMIYLDNNATTAIDPRVARVLNEALLKGPLNASSQHQCGQQARYQLESSLDQIARVLGSDLTRVDADRLIVTSGGTESNNIAVRGLGAPASGLAVSSTEHPSVLATAKFVETAKFL